MRSVVECRPRFPSCNIVTMNEMPVVGQRWICHSDASLGLGQIQSVEGRRIEIFFPAVNESRHFAIDNAPLSRIVYQVGDRLSDMDEVEYQVSEVLEHRGLKIYVCEDANGQSHQITEMQLNCYVQFSAPEQRLLNGQIDDESSYQLRYDTFERLDKLAQSPVNGLMGARVELLPHQVYIAREVASRFAPRVLLADEVGLGKTIEAGMIIHHQLHTGRSSRVLILVPDSLVHQWLVEMLRRFNLRFALFDESRFAALSESPDIDLDTGEPVNPFEMEQLIICSIDGLMRHKAMQDELLKCHWDLLVVDEAHHLQWSEQQVSADYQLVEQVGQRAKGLLLLTATPEQAGLDSHFARLRLLDPDRFHDLAAFRDEAGQYEGISQLVDKLNQQGAVTGAELKSILPQGMALELPENELDNSARQQLLEQLIDQHGTGRVLFRNTRSAISGFPERRLHTYPLSCPEIYTPEDDEPLHLGWAGLTPERELVPEVWLSRDPRVDWLEQKLSELKPEKVLVIAHHASTAKTLQSHFSKKLGFKCSCFHEGMTLVERDRAAAYFADRDEGAQILFCSEIGSEGRNFQFAHHLIFFDLPGNPDLVEQRIGRLDRIGQRDTIEIHVPYLQPSAQSVLFDWYHQGLNLFEQSFSAGYSVFESKLSTLSEALQSPESDHGGLINSTRDQVSELRQQMDQGRDRLLELNSCRQPQADQWVEQILEQEDPHQLGNYFEQLLDEFGVEQEDHSTLSWVLRPSDHMKHSYFPGLREEGTTVTLDRLKALSRDDIEFLSWEHPMVVEAMDMLAKSDTGNATAVTISVKGLKPGTLLMESYFTLQSIAPKELQIHRFLSQQPIRVLIDANGKDLSQVVSHKALNGLSQPLKKKVARQVIEQVKKQVESMVSRSESLVESRVSELKQSAMAKVNQLLGGECQRLKDLKVVNPNIRDEEIVILKQLIERSLKHIDKASLQLQGVKLIVAS